MEEEEDYSDEALRRKAMETGRVQIKIVSEKVSGFTTQDIFGRTYSQSDATNAYFLKQAIEKSTNPQMQGLKKDIQKVSVEALAQELHDARSEEFARVWNTSKLTNSS